MCHSTHQIIPGQFNRHEVQGVDTDDLSTFRVLLIIRPADFPIQL